MGWFWKSSYEKNKPAYNMYLHAKKYSEAESDAMQEPMDFYGLSKDEMRKVIDKGQREGWGADRLKD